MTRTQIIINASILNFKDITVCDDIVSIPVHKTAENREIFNEIFNSMTYVDNPFADKTSELHFFISRDFDDNLECGYMAINEDLECQCFSEVNEDSEDIAEILAKTGF